MDGVLMDKLMDLLVAAFARWAGVTNADELIAKIAAAVKAELADELAKLENLPAEVISQMAGQLAALPGQVLGVLPNFATIIEQSIQQAITGLNPFKLP